MSIDICHALLCKYDLLIVYTVYGTMSIAAFTKTGIIFIIYALECKIHLLCEIKYTTLHNDYKSNNILYIFNSFKYVFLDITM